MEVTLENYQQLAMRTAMKLERADALVHAALGIASEIGEIAKAEHDGARSLECGDLFWFVAYANATLDNTSFFALMGRAVLHQHEVYGNGVDVFKAVLEQVEEFITAAKAHKFYGKPLDTVAATDALVGAAAAALILCYWAGHRPVETLQMNIEKLRKRYPAAYSNADALERKDEVNNEDRRFFAVSAEESYTAGIVKAEAEELGEEATSSYTNQD